jgi:hypothetical protein
MEFPPNWTHEQLCERLLRELLIDQKQILANQETQMSALTDLQASVTAASQKVTTLSADVNAFIAANSGGASDADLVALKASVDAITTSVAAIDAIVNPPAPAA